MNMHTRQAFVWGLAGAGLLGLSLAAGQSRHGAGSEEEAVAEEVDLLLRAPELESYRTGLRDIASTYVELGELRGHVDTERTFAAALGLIDRLELEDLAELARLQPNLQANLDRLKGAVDGLHALVLDDAAQAVSAGAPPESPGLPDASYSSQCGSTRPSTGTAFAALLAFTVADGAREGASRGCDQVAVAAGFGGNAALVCLVLDVVRQGAKGFYDGLVFCLDDIDSAEIEGSYERLGHLHGDVEQVQAAVVDGIDEIQETVDVIDEKVDILDQRVVVLDDRVIKLDGRIVVLDGRVVVLDGKVDELAAAVEELRQANCDIIRLLNTPQGARASMIPVCGDQPGFPYDWPEP